MKKLLFILVLILTFNLAFGQTTVGIFKLPDATTQFGKIKPIGTIVYDESAKKFYRLTEKGLATSTLSTVTKELSEALPYYSNGDSLILTDLSGVDSVYIFDDGDTTRLESLNPIKIGENLIVNEQLELIGNFKLPITTSSSIGVIYKESNRFIHNFSHPTGGTAIPVGHNTFFGVNAGNFTMGSTATNTSDASCNIAIGTSAFFSNTTGYRNIANGYTALYSNTTGYQNIANGYTALYFNTTGYRNTANGSYALCSNTTGYQNTANGYAAGRYIANGTSPNETTNSSVYIGYNTKASADGVTNENVFGYGATGIGSNSVVLGDDNVVTTLLKGNVGIGTNNPSELLDINGNLIVLDTAKISTISATELIIEADSVKVSGNFTSDPMLSCYEFKDSSLLLDLTVNIWKRVTNPTKTLFTSNVAEDFVNAGDTIVATDYCKYASVFYSLSATFSDNDIYKISVLKNGTIRIDGATFSGKGTTATITGKCIPPVASGDWFELQIVNTTDNDDVTVISGTLVIIKQF